jgi:hypothetical protein
MALATIPIPVVSGVSQLEPASETRSGQVLKNPFRRRTRRRRLLQLRPTGSKHVSKKPLSQSKTVKQNTCPANGSKIALANLPVEKNPEHLELRACQALSTARVLIPEGRRRGYKLYAKLYLHIYS